MPLANGKLPRDSLRALLDRVRSVDRRVVIGPDVGEDAAVLDVADLGYVVAKTDPITFPTPRPGFYAVHVNANDVACMGASPGFFLATILAPEGTELTAITSVFDDIRGACESVGAVLVGGHTEVTDAVTRMVVCGQMIGSVDRERLLRKTDARPEDRVLVTQQLAIEGTCLLASAFGDELRADCVLSEEEVARAQRLSEDPGLSVVSAALALRDLEGVRGLHDVTEGGIASAIHEFCDASQLGCRISGSAMPISDLTVRICRHLVLDPLGLLASGSLLIVAAPAAVAAIMLTLGAMNVPCADVGVLRRGEGRILSDSDDTRPLPSFSTDEVVRGLRWRRR